MSTKKKTAAELQSEADKLAEKLKQVREEARKARKVEKLKAEREKFEREKLEAYNLIQVAKTSKIDCNGQSVTIYEYLKALAK